ncbi:hypothetical protein NG895_26920 [Aeoliella sp. ICT_H6.2]|uniref:Uncharacterized protein n=1 Tax=Aeoliella straminimaris TaxID=2954799 RepID=A0A9X2FFX5_9BACT|nr:hypothetical protein [Aeoliella straminimaris]MCO6047553.1 hypothetical protein [Aeoliella straminimaris]
MNDSSENDRDRELEREIRERRKFSLAEAIGRLGGGKLMKGASPVTRERQAEILIESYLQQHLRDSEGTLQRVLLRRVVGSQRLLESGYEQPLEALAEYCQRLLDSEGHLQDFVRAVDAEWGRMYLERPRFERPDHPPADDDPYTYASVARQLQQLVSHITGESGSE